MPGAVPNIRRHFISKYLWPESNTSCNFYTPWRLLLLLLLADTKSKAELTWPGGQECFGQQSADMNGFYDLRSSIEESEHCVHSVPK